MSLRRRIAAAAAVAVAAVAVAVAVTGYLSTRSHLVGEVKRELRHQAQVFLAPHQHHFGFQGSGPSGVNDERSEFQAPGPVEPGGPSGLVQAVNPNGTIARPSSPTLPVTDSVRRIAQNGSGTLFYDAHVSGTHYEVYAAWDAPDHRVDQVALPLTEADSVLSSLLLPYALLIGGGILLAALLGLAISRSALRPIERFVARTELVTRELEHPARLEEADTVELRRLGASFNQTLDALERSIEAQRQLVVDASHELRTPIAALRSNIQIFLDADRLPVGEREELQQSIIAELDELTQIVADVLELARGSSPSVRAEPVELDTVARDAVERAQRRGPELGFELDLEPTVVDGVPEQIARAVANVVDNARKWSPPDGRVEVRLHDGTLTVRDHGPGFAEKDLAHVFDRFYRAEQARRMPGSGLGLAIVKQAAEAHGGSARVANAPDGGAIVSVSFGPPLRSLRPEPREAPAPEPSGAAS